MLARSVHQFHYQDFFSIGAPPQSQYPPGFPALLAIASWPFGEHLDLMLATVCLCSIVALAVFYHLIRRQSGPGVGLAVLALAAVNPRQITSAGHVLSDTPYLMLTAVALWAMVHDARTSAGEPSRVRALIAGAAAILAALTRTAGVTLIGAILLVWLFERRYRRAAVFLAAVAVTFGSWLAWSSSRSNGIVGRSYVADFTARAQPRTSLMITLVSRVPSNLTDYATTELPSGLPQPTLVTVVKHLNWPAARMRSAVAVDRLVSVVGLLVFGLLGVWALWSRSRVVVVYLGMSCLLLAVYTWAVFRFVLPLLPILFWALVLGAISLGAWRRWARPVPLLAVGGILAMAIAHDVQLLRDVPLCDRAAPTTSAGCFGEVAQGFFRAADFIRAATPDSAVFLSASDAQLAYLTGRQTEFSANVARVSPESLVATLHHRRVGYVMLSPFRSPEQQLIPTLAAACRELEPVREFAGSTLLLRITPTGSEPPENACDSIDRYSKNVINQSLWPPRRPQSTNERGEGTVVRGNNLDRGE
jgi:hypothetical protein